VTDARRNVRLYSTIKDRKSPLKGSRASVPHGTNFYILLMFVCSGKTQSLCCGFSALVGECMLYCFMFTSITAILCFVGRFRRFYRASSLPSRTLPREASLSPRASDSKRMTDAVAHSKNVE